MSDDILVECVFQNATACNNKKKTLKLDPGESLFVRGGHQDIVRLRSLQLVSHEMPKISPLKPHNSTDKRITKLELFMIPPQ